MKLKLTNSVTRPMAAAAAIALLGLTLGSAQAATVPFSDNFNDTNDDDFVLTGSTFSMGGATLDLLTGNNSTQAGATVPLTNADGVDLLMSITLSLTSIATNSDMGFLAFSDTADLVSTGYIADFKGDGSMRILGPVGFGTTIASAPAGTITPFAGETYTLTLRATPAGGGTLDLTLTIDDPSSGLASISGNSVSAAATGNFFGLRTRTGSGTDSVAAFDDFSVTVVPEPSSLTLVALGLVGMVSLRKRNRC